MPPLRSRLDDLGRLFRHFFIDQLRTIHEEHRLERPWPDSDVRGLARFVEQMALHSWPGNVRELRNVVKRLVIASRGRPEMAINESLAHLEKSGGGNPPWEAVEPLATRPRRDAESLSEPELKSALAAQRWNIAATARHLGLSRTALYKRIATSPGLRIAANLSREEIVRCQAETGERLEEMAERLGVSLRALKQRMKALGLRGRSSP